MNFENNPTFNCTKCGAINSIIFNYKDGIEVCCCCGLIYEDKIIDDHYEQRNFGAENNGENKLSRVGATEKTPNASSNKLAVKISGQTKIFKSNAMLTAEEKKLNKINEILSKKDIADCLIEDAKSFFDKINKKEKKRVNMEIFVAALYYNSSKAIGVPKTFKEVSEIFGIKEKEIKSNYFKLRKYFHINDKQRKNDYKNYIRTFCENFNDNDVRDLATKIVTNIENSSLLDGREPNTIIGLSLILALSLKPESKIKKDDIYKSFSSKANLNGICKKFREKLINFLPEEYRVKFNQILLNEDFLKIIS